MSLQSCNWNRFKEWVKLINTWKHISNSFIIFFCNKILKFPCTLILFYEQDTIFLKSQLCILNQEISLIICLCYTYTNISCQRLWNGLKRISPVAGIAMSSIRILTVPLHFCIPFLNIHILFPDGPWDDTLGITNSVA